MDDSLVLKIMEACKLITENTNKDDVLIFVGQSPNLIYHVVKNIDNHLINSYTL